MKFGVFLPISGKAASSVLVGAARGAEAAGYDSIWAADRIVIPWRIRTSYPYKEDQQFLVPPDRPFLEPLTCLAFLAGCAARIALGMSVLVLPYRHPLYWAKIATTIDHLSKGRLILGVGVGWMVEEFEARRAARAARVPVGGRALPVRGPPLPVQGRRLLPKPLQTPRVPTWVGGEGAPAQRRAARYGDAWFPYFVRIAPPRRSRCRSRKAD